jgi:cytidine deaminase
MQKANINFEYEIYHSINELNSTDQELLEEARSVTSIAYAPYSDFQVGAVALLSNGEKVKGTNQENASFPVGICAERTLLASAAMLHTNVPIITMAIAYNNLNAKSDVPVSPCGMCRQALHEYENRTKNPIRIILSGMEGKVFIIESASFLLPLSFGGDVLTKSID